MYGTRIGRWAVLFGCVACSDASFDAADTSAGANMGEGFDEDTGVGTDAMVPAWWRLDAGLSISAGQLSTAESGLTVHVLDDAGEVICSEEFRLVDTDTMEDRPDPMILTWWLLVRGEGTGTCSDVVDLSSLPAELYVGVGEMHPELEAVAGQVEDWLEAPTGHLNGAYARVDPNVDDIWVYGFAGDVNAWAGMDGPATVAPLSDGLWTLRGVYSFPLP